jgi:hypothetical protein
LPHKFWWVNWLLPKQHLKKEQSQESASQRHAAEKCRATAAVLMSVSAEAPEGAAKMDGTNERLGVSMKSTYLNTARRGYHENRKYMCLFFTILRILGIQSMKSNV